MINMKGCFGLYKVIVPQFTGETEVTKPTTFPYQHEMCSACLSPSRLVPENVFKLLTTAPSHFLTN